MEIQLKFEIDEHVLQAGRQNPTVGAFFDRHTLPQALKQVLETGLNCYISQYDSGSAQRSPEMQVAVLLQKALQVEPIQNAVALRDNELAEIEKLRQEVAATGEHWKATQGAQFAAAIELGKLNQRTAAVWEHYARRLEVTLTLKSEEPSR